MLKRCLAAAAIAAAMSGCASTAEMDDKVAGADQKEVYCQTDDGTGSRLQPRTTCNNGVNTADQAAVRAMQNQNR